MPLFSDASLAAEYAERSGNGVHMIRRRPGANDITRFFVIDQGASVSAGRRHVADTLAQYVLAESLVSYQFYETTEKLRRDYPEHFVMASPSLKLAPADPHANGCPDAPGICECFAKR